MSFKNLGMAVAELETEFQYAPEILAHRADFRNIVRRNHDALSREERWSWLWDSRPVVALPDMTFIAGSGGITKTIGGGDRSFNIARIPLQAAIGAANPINPAILEAMNNGLMNITATDKTLGNGNWELGPFSIERMQIQSPDTAWTLNSFDLDPAAVITSFVGDEGGVKLSFPRIQLPVECDQLITVKDQNGVPLTAISPREAREKLWTRTSSGSTPAFVVEDQGFDLPDPRFLQTQNATGGVHPRTSPFSAQRENWPFNETFTLSDSAGTGTFVIGTQVRVFCSWFYGNRFGPPSAVQTFTIADHQGIKLNGLPVLPQTTATFEYGRRIAVFVSQDEGAFYFRGFQTSPTATTLEILLGNRDPASTGVGLRHARWDELFGTYKYIRLYPTVSSMLRLNIEYWRRPRQLVEDTDAPEFDDAFHDLIVWRSCLDLASRPNMGTAEMVQRFQANYDRQFSAYCTRYLPSERYSGSQKGMIGQQRRLAPLFRSVDWHGDT